MLDLLLRDEEETPGKRNAILQKAGENENGKKKDTYT